MRQLQEVNLREIKVGHEYVMILQTLPTVDKLMPLTVEICNGAEIFIEINRRFYLEGWEGELGDFYKDVARKLEEKSTKCLRMTILKL